MPASSRSRIRFTRRPHPLRRLAVAGTCTAVAAAAAWALWGPHDPLDDARGPVVLHPRESRASIAVMAPPPVLAASSAALAVAPAPADVAASQVAVAAALPIRAAIDSGRAQPVFLGMAAAKAARVGQPFELDITAESENDFAGGTLVVEFDAKRMKVAAVRPGTFMSQAGAAARVTHAVDPQAGRLTIDVAEEAGGPPVSGGGTLVTVEFTPTQRGEARFVLASAVLRDLRDEGVASSTVAPHAVTIGN